MAEPGSGARDAAAWPSAEVLVNLTEHAIVLPSWVPSDTDDEADAAAEPSTLYLPPDGRLARVDDREARLGEGSLSTAAGLVRLTRMRRSSRLVDLPAPVRGTRFVVSRLTALAARNRTDLVFPFSEIRDSNGQIVGVRGLASFRRSLAVAQRYRDQRAATGDRRARRREPRQWLTAVMFAAATALLSGALGLLPGALDFASASGWGAAWRTWTLRLTVGFGVAGAGLLGPTRLKRGGCHQRPQAMRQGRQPRYSRPERTGVLRSGSRRVLVLLVAVATADRVG
jgi:hypothetical protein